MKFLYRLAYYLVICWHYGVAGCFIYGFFAVMSYPLWVINAYIALCLLIIRTQQRCELTALECFLAKKIGKPVHDNFIVHWIVRPIRTFVDLYGERSANAVVNYLKRKRK